MHPLDNVIWTSLTTAHARFAEASGHARRFPEEISLLGAVREHTAEAYNALASLTQRRPVGLFLPVGLSLDEQPPVGWRTAAVKPLLQMICENDSLLGLPPSDAPNLVELGAVESPQMTALTELTRPGPFGPRTHEFGRYIGIMEEGNLVAMAGERLRLPGYTEISAVCTHPNRTGRGYARLLMTDVMRRIFQRGERPILHVRGDNTSAIELYRRLGFRDRLHSYYAIIEYGEGEPAS
jgi:ribosomal protein S18 acetylase RimI-like enzyme